jgi:DNA primase
MSGVQENLIAQHFAEVVIMLDGDQAGRRAADEICDRLERVVFRVATVELGDGVQPDQLTGDELRAVLGACS